MSGSHAAYAFTKLVVHDLEKMAAFYCEAYGLRRIARVQARIGAAPIDEIMLGAGTEVASASLVLLRFVGAPPPASGEVILGFTTGDLAALLDRVRAAGGGVHADARDMPEHGVRVAFATDPEGHLAELVQLLGASTPGPGVGVNLTARRVDEKARPRG
jgi:predicted enzyme related to lactoylglutathione lyase